MDLLRHLRCFVAVAEELHFGRAAERLHMAQPPLSQRVRALESALDARLLDRTSRRVSLTPAGSALLPEARTLLAQADALGEVVARAVAEDTRPVLRTAVSADLPAEVLDAVRRAFRARSDAHLELQPCGPSEIPRALGAGELQAAVVRQPAAASSGDVLLTVTARLGVLLRADDPLAAQSDVAPAELGERVLVRPTDTAGAEELLISLAAHGWVPTRTAPSRDGEWARALVLGGDSVLVTERPVSVPDCVRWLPLAASLTARCSVLAVAPAPPGVAELVDAVREALVRTGGWSAPAPRPAPPEGPLG